MKIIKLENRITPTANLPYQSRTRHASLRKLAGTLERADCPTRILSFPDGTRLLLLQRGGRVLGCFPGERGRNFLWTHDALRSSDSIRRLYAEARWPNPGGDRTWLAPVPELFFADMSRLWETFCEPPALDPGRYAWQKGGGVPRLVNRATLQLFRTGTKAAVEISKQFHPAPDPLRYDCLSKQNYTYAGYTSTVSLRFLSNPLKARRPLGLYQLLQLPPGGRMIIPLHSRTKPLIMFGRIPQGRLVTENHVVRYTMAATTTAKIAVRAAQSTGRIGYLHRNADGEFDLVVRNCFVNPSGEYVDPPFDNLNDLGYSFQACNVAEPTLGFFSELEHHAPAVGVGTGANACTDVTQVWAFRGAGSVIFKIARMLLGTV